MSTDRRRQSRRVTVLIADAQPLFSEALSVALTRFPGFSVVDDRPDSAEAALEAVKRKRPDVTLVDFWLDAALPKAALVMKIRSACRSTRVLVTSNMHSRQDIEIAMQSGAAGFVPKGIRVARLAEAISLAASGEQVFAEELQELTERVDHEDRKAVTFWRLFETLTARELEIVNLLALGNSRKQIADALSLSPHTVRTYLGRIFRKTETSSQLDLVARARSHGLV